MARTKKGQAEHDREVRGIANEYLRKGYKVLADLPDWERPDTIRGVRPDLLVSKKGHKTAIEVETPDSRDSARDLEQKKAFKNWSKDNLHKHFRRIITEE